MTVSHLVAPWKWPKLYPDPWLQTIDERHTHYTMEVRYDDGVFINQMDLLPRAFHHPSRDLAILHLESEDETVQLWQDLGFGTELDILDEKHPQYPLKEEQV
jgi:hypothetical protein